MDRKTRKANLKKLQLPSKAEKTQKRTISQIDRTPAATNTAISKYFLSPEKHKPVGKKQSASNKSPVKCTINKRSEDAMKSSDIHVDKNPLKRVKRTKLDAFLFKNPNDIPDSVKSVRKSLKDDDFDGAEKKIKRAPKVIATENQSKTLKASRTKKQTSIKSAFLRNEQLFAEIAAQHCGVEHFDGDDVQLALAISKSEAESKGIGTVNENTIDDKVNVLDGADQAESIRTKLRMYGFRTAEKKDYNTFANAFLPGINVRRGKAKWANKFTALTLRSPENQLRKLQESIEKLLNSQFRVKPLNAEETLVPIYKLKSSLLKKLAANENERVLQTVENENQPNELYFVKDLFEISNVPAGRLLKDWTAIQGRDLTPTQSNKETAKKLKILDGIYYDLEEYFSSRKKLNWTKSSSNESQKVSIFNDKEQQQDGGAVIENGLNLVKTIQRSELVELSQGIQQIKEPDSKKADINHSGSTCEKKVLRFLPTAKSLDKMQVSSCSLSTQATITSTQRNRSSSPDLFADSDVDTEDECDKTKVEAVISNEKGKEEEERANLTTYEIFSSDEVKNSISLEHNKSIAKESLSHNFFHNSNDIIDLTQDDAKACGSNKSKFKINQTKQIVEIDLFSESSPQEENNDINNISPILKEIQVIGGFTLNPSTENELEETAPSLEIKKQLKEFTICNTGDYSDAVLNGLGEEQLDASFLNFQNSKQLKTSFHKSTAITQNVESGVLTDELADNNTFLELCNKYLNYESANLSAVNKSEFNICRKSVSQILTVQQSPEKCDNFEKDFILNRKSLPFTAKTPSNTKSNYAGIQLYKSKSFNNNNNKSDASIDLTQNYNEFDNVGSEIGDEEEDDDCLVLSDDEINYSIWRANKTENFQNFKLLDQEDNIVSVLDDENNHYFHARDREKHVTPMPLEAKKSVGDFEILTSRYAALSSPAKDDNEFGAFRTKNSLKKLGDLNRKYATSNLAIKDNSQFDISEFGVLDECSETLDFTPNLPTPTKILTEASFLSSPTETTVPMKRYSRSLQKFEDLINSLEAKSLPYDNDEFSDFDDIDRLVYSSPSKLAKSSKKPAGFDKLLTGKINYKEIPKAPEISQPLVSTTEEVKYNNKIYTVRYNCSPKPDYTKYTEAQLLKELYNFGIKPLKRKQAIKMLEYIYNQTHPILTEEKKEEVMKQQDDFLTLDDFERPSTSKKAFEDNMLISKYTINTPNCDGNKLNLQDACGMEIFRYSTDITSELSEENYILQTNVTKKTAQPLLPFHIAWFNLVCSNQKLHEKILTYEPIDLLEIYLFLKALGYRYDPKDLKIFFDRRCIIFRYDLTSAADGNEKIKNKNRHVRKSQKNKSS